MSIDPRIALQSLMAALEEHLTAASRRRGDKDPLVESAYLAVADAFEVYEEVLYDAYGEVTPLEIYEDDDEENTIVLVTTLRNDVFGGYISKESPVGKAIMGHRVGDRVIVHVNADISYPVIIRSIEKGEDDTSLEIRKF